MTTWEERMAERHQAGIEKSAEAARRAYLGEAFLPFYLPEDRGAFGSEPLVEICPEIIAARCLGISYGDPGPVLPPEVCRQCWGERHVWLGNCWGVEHTGGDVWDSSWRDHCRHECHEGEVWMA